MLFFPFASSPPPRTHSMASTSAFQVVTPTASSSKASTSTRPASYHVHMSGHSDPRLEEDDEETGGEYGDDYTSSRTLATPGQPLGSLTTYMRGHGTHLVAPPTSSSQQAAAAAAATISSSLAGRVLLTNRLLSLSPLSHRYTPETGDLLLGRVKSVLPGARKWKIDISSSSGSASLALSAINLPGGVQRRKLASDELQMRTFLREGDLLVAEVQGVFADGGVGLHTRSLRYGKLRNGRLVRVPVGLVRRGRSHFIKLARPGGEGGEVEMILGLNGWIWLSAVGAREGTTAGAQQAREGEENGDEATGMGGRGVGRDVDASGTYSDELKVGSAMRRLAQHTSR